LATTREIRRRIRSVEGIREITRAMKMVALTQLRKAQAALFAFRPYSDETLSLLIRYLSTTRDEEGHPLLVPRPVNSLALVVLTADKGLCGAFNANIIRRARQVLASSEAKDKKLILIGRKGLVFFRRREFPILASFTDIYDQLGYGLVSAISEKLREYFLSGEADQIQIVSAHFVSGLVQQVALSTLLPLESEELLNTLQARRLAASRSEEKASEREEEKETETAEEDIYLYEPSKAAVTEALLTRFLAVELYRLLLENSCSEQAARMMAMDAATDNAADLIGELSLQYNRARQTAITKELLDITTGAEALKRGRL
jgi:F-type H+-transporting ATPase subunit gamma